MNLSSYMLLFWQKLFSKINFDWRIQYHKFFQALYLYECIGDNHIHEEHIDLSTVECDPGDVIKS